MVAHYLEQWGCPAELLNRLRVGSSTCSRHLLLALVWLATDSGLFGRALSELEVPLQLLPLLPPYPQVS